MKKFLIILGLVLASTALGYLARDGLEMKTLYDTLPTPSTSVAPVAAPISDSTVSDPYYREPPTRLLPTWPQHVDPRPLGERTAQPTILNGFESR